MGVGGVGRRRDGAFLGGGAGGGAGDVGVGDLQLLLVDGELDRGGGGHGAEVVHAGLEAELPAGEVHAGDLAHGRLLEVDVERLRLVDEGAAVRRHLHDGALGNLPDRFVECFDVAGDVGDVLDGAAVGDDSILHVVRPEAHVDQVLEQPRVDDLELASQDPARVDVGCVRLEAFVEAEDLARAGGWHGSDEETVADAMLGDVGFQGIPVPQVRRRDVPHVILQDAL